MDSFEHVIAMLLNREGFWTQTSLKVDLTAQDKKDIKRPTCPRWELDVVGYKGKGNKLLVMECKSYIDSYGVRTKTFKNPTSTEKARYKLFFDDKLRNVVLNRLAKQLVDSGSCKSKPTISFGLAAGNIYGEEEWLQNHFEEKGWKLWGPTDIYSKLAKLMDEDYENSIASVVAKLILRHQEKRLKNTIKAWKIKATRESVNTTLSELLKNKKHLGILDLFGKIDFDPNYHYKDHRSRKKSLRKGRGGVK